jgi:hypothetical protein
MFTVTGAEKYVMLFKKLALGGAVMCKQVSN